MPDHVALEEDPGVLASAEAEIRRRKSLLGVYLILLLLPLAAIGLLLAFGRSDEARLQKAENLDEKVEKVERSIGRVPDEVRTLRGELKEIRTVSTEAREKVAGLDGVREQLAAREARANEIEALARDAKERADGAAEFARALERRAEDMQRDVELAMKNAGGGPDTELRRHVEELTGQLRNLENRFERVAARPVREGRPRRAGIISQAPSLRDVRGRCQIRLDDPARTRPGHEFIVRARQAYVAIVKVYEIDGNIASGFVISGSRINPQLPVRTSMPVFAISE